MDDREWLIHAGKNEWVVLTKDRQIKSNQIEIAALISASTACFNLVSANMTGSEMAKAFLAAMHDMKRMLVKIDRPFVANVTRAGGVNLLYRYADLAKKLD